MKKITNYLSTMLLLGIVVLSSCKKEKDIVNTRTKADDFKLIAYKQNHLNQIPMDMVTMVMSRISGGYDGTLRLSQAYRTFDCGDMVIDSTVFPYTFEIEFGPDCTGPNGHPISGTVTGIFNNKNFDVTGDFVEITSSNLVFDTFTVSGTARLEVTANLSGNNRQGAFQSNIVTNYTYSQFEVNGQMNFTLEYVEDPITGEGDVLLEGGGSGVTNGGLSYTQSVISPLLIHTGRLCNYRHFLQGIILIQTSGLSDKEIDYGNGACDNIAHVTVDGVRDRIFLD